MHLLRTVALKARLRLQDEGYCYRSYMLTKFITQEQNCIESRHTG